MYYRMSAAQTADLADASELTLYSGGYGGIQPVENGITNFCCVVQRRYSRAGLRWDGLLAKMQQDCPHLAMRLSGVEPLLDKPITLLISRTATSAAQPRMGSTASAIRQP